MSADGRCEMQRLGAYPSPTGDLPCQEVLELEEQLELQVTLNARLVETLQELRTVFQAAVEGTPLLHFATVAWITRVDTLLSDSGLEAARAMLAGFGECCLNCREVKPA